MHGDKLYIFGGCHDFNSKRHIRDTTNQLVEIDLTTREMRPLNPKGISVSPRRGHTAVVFKDSMIVLGGTSETMILTQQMIAYNFED